MVEGAQNGGNDGSRKVVVVSYGGDEIAKGRAD